MSDDTDDPPKQFRRVPPLAAEEQKALDGDERGNLEAQQLNRGKTETELRKEAAAQSKHKRDELFRFHFGLITVIALYVMAAGVLVFAFIWAWHTLMPSCWRWLHDADIEKIQNIVTGGVLAGLIADQFRRRMD